MLLLRLEGEGSNLAAQLDHLYAKYGLHTRYNKIEKNSLKITETHTDTLHLLHSSISSFTYSSLNSYYICHDPAVTAAIFARYILIYSHI